MDVIVTTQTGSPNATAEVNGQMVACIIGQHGPKPATLKREGDGCTPLGTWQVLYGFYRADRVAKPAGNLPWRALTPDDGWCDAPTDPLYNQSVPVGYPASHEVMLREDTAYDYVVVLGHNQPPVAGAGSAVFLHVWHPGKTHTAGCVALKVADMARVVASLTRESVVDVR
ncbi:MAG: L,D-transpeptidase family protein [Alphaproteobacteria bacterium]